MADGEKSSIIELVNSEEFNDYEPVSNWQCRYHNIYKQMGVSFNDIAEIGVPICSECGENMKLVSTKLVKK